MECLRSRNPQSALPALLNMLYANGVSKDGKLSLPDPATFVYEKPRERLIFWPGFHRNPAKELVAALGALRQIEDVIPKAAADVVAGREHFIFFTPQMTVQANIDSNNKFNMRTVVAESNPFHGAFGYLALQLTLLHELMANSVKIDMGTFSIQHMSISADKEVIEMLLKESLNNIPKDPYQNGVKIRKIDGNINMAMLLDEGVAAQGYRSKWVRSVALMLFHSAQCESFDAAISWAKKIKADDWKLAQITYLEALKVASANQAAAELAKRETADGDR